MRSALFYRVCTTCKIRAVDKASNALCAVCNAIFWEIESDTLLQKIARLFTNG